MESLITGATSTLFSGVELELAHELSCSMERQISAQEQSISG